MLPLHIAQLRIHSDPGAPAAHPAIILRMKRLPGVSIYWRIVIQLLIANC